MIKIILYVLIYFWALIASCWIADKTATRTARLIIKSLDFKEPEKIYSFTYSFTKFIFLTFTFVLFVVLLKLDSKTPQQIAIPSIGRIKVDIYNEVQKIQKEIDILERIVLNHKELFSSFMNRIDIDFNKEKEQLYKEVEYNIKKMRAYLRYLKDEDLSNISKLDQGKDIIDLKPDGVKNKISSKIDTKKILRNGKENFCEQIESSLNKDDLEYAMSKPLNELTVLHDRRNKKYIVTTLDFKQDLDRECFQYSIQLENHSTTVPCFYENCVLFLQH